MAERKVVGWFWRNGHRIPIFEKSGISSGKPGKQSTARTSARVERDYVNAAMEGASRAGGSVPEEAVKYTVEKNIDLTNANRQTIRDRVKARDRKSRNEILDYDHDAAKVYEGIFDVASPREVANDMGKRVRTGDGKIVRPVKRSGIDLETRVNNYAAEVAERELNTPSQTFASASKRFKDKAAAEGKTVYEVNSEGNISGVIKPKSEGQSGARKIKPRYKVKGPGKVTGKTAAELENKTFTERGLKLDSADRHDMVSGSKAINGERVTLYGKNKKMSATYNKYSDGDKELINFKREPYPEGLRKNAKALGRTSIKRPAESYIKSVMEDRGLTRAEALKYIKEQRKKK